MNGTPGTLLEVHNLTKIFPVGKWLNLHAVDNVSFNLQKGESLGLVGESGCGKSTISRMLGKLLPITSGHILLDGQSISLSEPSEFSRDPRRARIQVVFQDSNDSLDPGKKGFEAIAEPLRILKKITGKAELKSRVYALAELTGLSIDLLDRYPHQLSGGQKARIGIARALAPEPDILILDEPSAALDVSIQAIILKMLAELRKKLGLAMIFVSHDLHLIRLLCDYVAVMYSGKLVEYGPVATVTESPKHPYTQALLSSIPNPLQAIATEADAVMAQALKSEAISPINPNPNQCRFVSRCPYAAAICSEVYPESFGYAPEHRVACHRYSMPEKFAQAK